MPEHNEPGAAHVTEESLDRRTLLRGAAVGGVALPLLAACGSGGDGTGSGSGNAGSGSGTRSGDRPAGGGTTVAASAVPVGGGKILAEGKVVVTQPTKGTFKAFSGVCTHQGCLVQTISDGRINCPCHGSAFSVKDGSVVQGPATQPLQNLSVKVQGGQVTVS